jgi:hypothetical protein
MAYGSKKFRFRKKKSRLKPMAYLFFFLILLGAGYFGWNLLAGGDQREANLTRQVQLTPNVVPPTATNSEDATLAPQEISVRRVLEHVLSLWVQSLVSEDFTAFHQSLSSSWKQKNTAEQLKQFYEALVPYKTKLELFPVRGKLVLLESRPFEESERGVTPVVIRDNLGPQHPWLVRGEWRAGRTALGFTLVLSYEEGQWLASGLQVNIFG